MDKPARENAEQVKITKGWPWECQRCGKCCRDLWEYSGTMRLGMYLLPDEVRFFDSQTRPLYRNSNKAVIAYQLAVAPCPHLTKSSKCDIYESRPLTCRRFPLTNLELSSRCGQAIFGMKVKIPGQMALIQDFIFSINTGAVEVFDLNSEQWFRMIDVAKDLVIRGEI